MDECSLNFEDELKLKQYIEDRGMIFLSTPFSRAAVDRLIEMNVPAFKIGSGECNYYPLIEYISSFKKPVINIGRRQNKRLKTYNVITLKTITYKNLDLSIKKIKTSKFQKKLKKLKNPYGDGKSSKRIINFLLNTKIDQKLLQKNITY